MPIRIVQVDAFTAEPFRGNPAAVCVLPEPRSEAWMQDVAREMNLSETAFLVRRGGSAFDLRWFTPTVEVALCGHATLASAHVLWESGQVGPGDQAQFHTKSGLLTADRRDGGIIELDFPSKPEEESPEPEGLQKALGARAVYIGKNAFDYIVEVESDAVVRGLKPDMSAVARLPVRGVMVTSRSGEVGIDFISRFFAPAAGVDEDPVTGSAHCCLAPFWASRLGKTEMVGYQASARGGLVRVRVAGDRVKLGGQAVTVMTGELLF
jgi:PhzF family phenazine biosynthesis protein